MENAFQIESIGTVYVDENRYAIQLDRKFVPGLKKLDGFNHLQVVWWAHLTDSPQERGLLVIDQLFKKGPDSMGVFATRSPFRPNPILISTIKVQSIAFDKGIIYTPFIDAEDKTPVLDIKPYFSMQRVKRCQNPAWCQHWPRWYEDTMAFDWSDEIMK